MKLKKRKCRQCGVPITAAGRSRHERGVWHREFPKIKLFTKFFQLSYAEIGRQLGLTRAYVRYQLRGRR